jgi:hypothetical protein
MKKISLLICLSFVVISLLASCQKSSSAWVEYKKDKDGTIYYKKIKTEKDSDKYVVQFKTKNIFSDEYKKEIIHSWEKHEKSIKGLNELSHDIDLFEMDCKKNRYRLLSSTIYNNYGEELYSTSHEKPKWNDIYPNSEMERVQKGFCK